MKQIIYVILLVLGITFNTTAQNLIQYIPKHANFVMAVHGNQWMQLASIPYFENTAVGKEFIKELKKDFDDVNSLNDLGIDFNKHAYFYMTSNDTISFFSIILPVQNRNSFQKFFAEMSNSDKEIFPVDSTVKIDEFYFRLNDQAAFIHIPIFVPKVFAAKYPYNRFGIEKMSYTPYYMSDSYFDYATPATAEAVEYEYTDDYASTNDLVDKVEEVGLVEIPVVETYDIVIEEATSDSHTATGVVAPKTIYEDEYVVPTPPTIMVSKDDEAISNYEEPSKDIWQEYKYDDSAYELAYRKQDSLKQILIDTMFAQMILPYYDNNKNLSSILSNKSFKKVYDKNALISIYMDGANNIFNYLYNIFGIDQHAILIEDYNYISSNTYIRNNEISVKSTIKVAPHARKEFKQLTNRKLNKNLLSYYDKNKVIGGISYAFNTESYLNYLNKELKKYYFDYYIKKEDVAIIADILALVIDEKAIDKAIKGDGLFLINDVKPTKVSYVTYEYDETDFRSKAVQKEKIETLPEFLMMYSTEDPTIHRKLMNYLAVKGILASKHGIYTVIDKYNDLEPFKWHVMVKDGIVFLSNSFETLEEINLSKYNKNIDCKTKRFIRKNAMTGFFYPEKLHNKINTGNINIDGELNAMLLKIDDVKMHTTKLKCGKMKSTLRAKVPNSQENGLKYIINGFNALYNLNRY